jgi:hypothetical protein
MILLIGITGILVAGHKNFSTMFKRINSDVVRNAYEARIIFDGIVRKSSIRREYLLPGGNDLTVYYYSDPQNTAIVDPDMYARFYLSTNGSEQELMLDQGQYTWATREPGGVSSSKVIAHNVVPPATGIFSIYGGNDIRMVLTLDNATSSDTKLSKSKMIVTSTAIRHNK